MELEQELRHRGVVAITFYDVVLDFILLDAFEDLEEPPSSVTAVVQNRWLSNSFKESVGIVWKAILLYLHFVSVCYLNWVCHLFLSC